MARTPIPLSLRSSSAFATTLALEPRPSRLARCWWRAAHGCAGAALLLAGLPPGVVTAGLALAGLHGWLRAPHPMPRVVVQAGGLWTVPAWGLRDAQPGRGSVRTPWVVRVVLTGPAGRHTLVLARDGLTAAEWRLLQALLGP